LGFRVSIKLTALPRYIPSSTFGNGKPIGFQRCVNADRIKGRNRRILFLNNMFID
jgi:hypothetical protein